MKAPRLGLWIHYWCSMFSISMFHLMYHFVHEVIDQPIKAHNWAKKLKIWPSFIPLLWSFWHLFVNESIFWNIKFYLHSIFVNRTVNRLKLEVTVYNVGAKMVISQMSIFQLISIDKWHQSPPSPSYHTPPFCGFCPVFLLILLFSASASPLCCSRRLQTVASTRIITLAWPESVRSSNIYAAGQQSVERRAGPVKIALARARECVKYRKHKQHEADCGRWRCEHFLRKNGNEFGH